MQEQGQPGLELQLPQGRGTSPSGLCWILQGRVPIVKLRPSKRLGDSLLAAVGCEHQGRPPGRQPHGQHPWMRRGEGSVDGNFLPSTAPQQGAAVSGQHPWGWPCHRHGSPMSLSPSCSPRSWDGSRSTLPSAGSGRTLCILLPGRCAVTDEALFPKRAAEDRAVFYQRVRCLLGQLCWPAQWPPCPQLQPVLRAQ